MTKRQFSRALVVLMVLVLMVGAGAGCKSREQRAIPDGGMTAVWGSEGSDPGQL